MAMPLVEDVIAAGSSQWLKRSYLRPEPQSSEIMAKELEKIGGYSILNGIPDVDYIDKHHNIPKHTRFLLAQWGTTVKECGSKLDCNTHVWYNRQFLRKVGRKRVSMPPRKLSELGFNRLGDFYGEDGVPINHDTAISRGLQKGLWLVWRSTVEILEEAVGDTIIVGFQRPYVSMSKGQTQGDSPPLVSSQTGDH